MAGQPAGNVTQLLKAVSSGRRERLDELLAAVYHELRALAGRHLRRERANHTLQATALVHEAYLKLVDQAAAAPADRSNFLAAAAGAFRRILVDHARARKAAKRGGGRGRLTLQEADAAMNQQPVDLVALDDALDGLARISPQQARIVELRFFGGLTIQETAEVVGMGKRSVDREWSCAKAWLYRALSQ